MIPELFFQDEEYSLDYGKKHLPPTFEVTFDLNTDVIPLKLLGPVGPEEAVVWQKELDLEGKGFTLIMR